MYGKIVDGNLLIAPKEIIENGYRYVGLLDVYLKNLGYKHVKSDSIPADCVITGETYEETDDYILVHYTFKETQSIEERLTAIEEEIVNTQMAMCEVYEILL